MGNRISTTPQPIIMTSSFLKEKVIHDMVKLNNLDSSELKKLVGDDNICWELINLLELEHQNLVNISDLWRFPWLTKLEMQSNLIEKIEGLETLKHLKVLDLSFNFIKHIEGLEKLFSLTHLNLTSNKISVLENLQQLHRLEMLLVRHNKISSFSSVLHLSQLLNLYSFGIEGNLLMNEDNSHLRVLSILPQLKILDFKAVTKKNLEEAFEKFPIAIKKHNLSDFTSALNPKCESKIPILCEVKVYPEV
ncbi:dynein regulatory complex subunit 3-like [Uloborus diversus]|uniref:dynein regulatory complex subunit 3-like n=1 Tax=Uloborus diversus TaxID=327109 RepID=UPI002409F2BE|nr:dynein regulatory complex subunit 3-like [Uloborus diversus]